MSKETPEEHVARILAERDGKPKHAGGRPTKYDPKVHPDLVAESDLGSATWLDIANACHVTMSTVKLWAEKHPEFSAAVTYAKDRADLRVENALYRRAIGDWKTPPDTKACTVWLGNRRPNEWRETSRVEVTGKDGGAIVHAEVANLSDEALVAEAEAICRRAVEAPGARVADEGLAAD